MAGGRPSKYSEELLEKARDYADNFEEYGDLIPTVAGLACELKVSRETIYDWASHEDKKEFSDIVCDIMSSQERKLVNGGIGNTFNAMITKLMLSKHGYSEKQEIDVTSREEVTPWGKISTDE